MLSRYHLWFAVPSRKQPRGVPTHSRAVTGAPGARLLSKKAVGVPAPRCIRRLLLSPFHHPGVLLAAPCRVLVLFLAVYAGYFIRFCKGCQWRISNSRHIKQKAPEIKDFRSFLVRREGFEPPAFWSVARRSIQLS